MSDRDAKHAPIEDRHKQAIHRMYADRATSHKTAMQLLADAEAEGYARGQLAGMELAQGLVCEQCKRGDPIKCMVGQPDVWVHPIENDRTGGGWACGATCIRDAIQAIQDAGGNE